MMFQLNNTTDAVPGDWWYDDPLTKMRIPHESHAGTYGNLLRMAREHRAANGLPCGINFELEVQDAICRRLPSGSERFFKEAQLDKPETLPERKTTVSDVIRWVDTMTEAARKKLIAHEDVLAPLEEAERRAKICVGCPRNVPIGGCVTCKDFIQQFFRRFGHRSLPSYDERLNGCDVCGCALKVAVHTDLEVQQAGISDEVNATFPACCWKKR